MTRKRGERTSGSTAGGRGFCCGMTWHKARPNREHTHSAGIRPRNLVYESEPPPLPPTAHQFVASKSNKTFGLVTNRLLFLMLLQWRALHTERILHFSRSSCDPTHSEHKGTRWRQEYLGVNGDNLEYVCPAGETNFMWGGKKGVASWSCRVSFSFLIIWEMVKPKHTYTQYFQSDVRV